MKKYELSDVTTFLYPGKKLTKIRALVDIPSIRVVAGQLGGFVESEDNLSHKGTCWIHDCAAVYDGASVCDNAQVYDQAIVSDHARVLDEARVKNYARVSNHAVISGNAHVVDCSSAQDGCTITDNAYVSGYSTVAGRLFIATGEYCSKIITNQSQVELSVEQPTNQMVVSCECGASKVGSPRHSSWCPLH